MLIWTHINSKFQVDIAFQILKIADQLTHNKDEFSLYLTDVSGSNFVLDPSGKVTIVDAGDIVVVDTQAVKSGKKIRCLCPHNLKLGEYCFWSVCMQKT